MTVVLHKYLPAWDMADLSPFCVKVETYLRMVGVAFEGRTSDVRKAPKGKLPWVEDGAARVCDSRDIIDHFEAKLPNALDRNLTEAERALCVAHRALLEEEAYFYALVLRWKTGGGWSIYRPIMHSYLTKIGIPSPLCGMVAAVVRRQVVGSARGQGAGRHSVEEIEGRLLNAMQATVTQLGEGPYFLGAEPHVIDASVYAFLSAALDAPFPSQAKDMLAGLDQVTTYRARMQERYFNDPAQALA